jgi:hypothetical protein
MSRKGDEEGLTVSQQYWLTHLNRADELGQGLVAYAGEHKLKPKSPYRYEGLNRERNEGKTVPVDSARLVRVSVPTPASCRVHLPNGCTVEWQSAPNSETMWEHSDQFEIIPVQFRVLQHQRMKYRCPCCESHIKTAPMTPQPIPKSMASPGLLAYIATAKFVDALPL